MNLYRTPKGTWVANQSEWKQVAREEGSDASGEPHKVDVPTNPKSALIDFLNRTTIPQQPVETVPEGQSIEEAFSELKPRVQLELAVRAIDNAGETISKLIGVIRSEK